MMLFTKKNKSCLADGTVREYPGNVPNPGRGWYRIYTYAPDAVQEGMLPPVIYEGETVALVMIDIGVYRERAIPSEGIALIRRILSAFAESGADMILRVVYDTQGRGMEREPTRFSQVMEHIGQIGALLPEYAEHILVFQGMFVGSWGEMHGSKFLTAKYLRQMTEHFLEVTEGRIRLAFRKPSLLREIAEEGDALRGRIGFFDDALLADGAHLGTFGMQARSEVGWTQAWRAEDEADFMAEAADRIPFGGEVLQGAEELGAEAVIEQMRRFRVSYLNCTHDAACLERWKQMMVKPGISLYDYVGRYLGYRFAVEKVFMSRKGKECRLSVDIVNQGFACCPQELELALCAGDGGREVLALEVGKLQGGERKTWNFSLQGSSLSAGEPLFLMLRSKGGAAVRFANEGADSRLFLGNYSPENR